MRKYHICLMTMLVVVSFSIEMGNSGPLDSITRILKIGKAKNLSKPNFQKNGLKKQRKLLKTRALHQQDVRIISKSEEKCEYYSKLRNEKILDNCKPSVAKKIIGGTWASSGEFPHMALWATLSSSAGEWACGASLISEQYLLTAGHCGQTSEGPFMAILGLNAPENSIIVNIAERIFHPDYNFFQCYNDIALFRLEKPVNFTKYIWPACLYTDENIKQNQAIATGWGKAEHKWDLEPLRKVTLPIKNISECTETYPPDWNLPRGINESSMICAGQKNPGKGTCIGDSGGPLQIINKKTNCMYSIIGVTSFGQTARGRDVSVFTKISPYIKWIESIVWPEI